jgi:hypothetical protein
MALQVPQVRLALQVQQVLTELVAAAEPELVSEQEHLLQVFAMMQLMYNSSIHLPVENSQ